MDAEYGVMVLYWPGLMALIRQLKSSAAGARIANEFSAFDRKAFLSGSRQTQHYPFKYFSQGTSRQMDGRY
jgi:hypothetical protein